MATQKKVATKKATHKAAAVKKVNHPVKKSAAKKAASKKTAVKKATPANKVVAKKSVAKKAAPKSAAKKSVSSKVVKKTIVAKQSTNSKKAVPAKKPVAKQAASPLKPATVKKPAKPVQSEPATPPVKGQKAPLAKSLQSAPVTRKPEPPSSSFHSTIGKTSLTYQPEFTKSVLDQPQESNGPIRRYSDAELQEFKDIILKKMERAKKELAYLQGLITRKDEAGTDDTENKYMSMEDGSGTMEREQLNQMASRQIQYIDHLEKALIRIENKTYGICRVTGKLIDKARLRAVPHATLSIEAKQAMSK